MLILLLVVGYLAAAHAELDCSPKFTPLTCAAPSTLTPPREVPASLATVTEGTP